MMKRIIFKFGFVMIVTCTVLFAGFGIAEAAFISSSMASWLQYAAAFACFGFMIGAILAFDNESGYKQKNRPFLRSLLSLVAGIAFGWVLNFPIDGIALSALVAAMLGYAGMFWAQYF